MKTLLVEDDQAIRALQRGHTVEIAVADSGPGVPPELREAIFVGQAEDFLTRRQGGIGVSLLMARRIAELHGGQLRVEAPARGARFVLALPIEIGPAHAV